MCLEGLGVPVYKKFQPDSEGGAGGGGPSGLGSDGIGGGRCIAVWWGWRPVT